MFARPLMLFFVFLSFALGPVAAAADTFRAMLGGRVLGTLEYRETGRDTGALRTTLNNTPLGVGDGVFDGQTRREPADGKALLRYRGDSTSSRKSRQISVLLDRGRVIEVEVNPAGERTALSVATSVPEGVIDPVTAFGRMISARDCPAAFAIYDGRRVIQVRPRGAVVEGAQKRCSMSYDVIAGPGHLSPFRFSALKLELLYRAGTLAMIEVRTGPFTLSLQR